MPNQPLCEPVMVVEIGGTKLQWGWTLDGGRSVQDLDRATVNRADGAQGILTRLGEELPALMAERSAAAIGIGFGGPVDPRTGRTITSHQVSGWEDFPLAAWCTERLGVPCTVLNDCNAAALAEARCGAGQGMRRVFYVTVGTGIGGGWVVDGELDGADRMAVAEIGHLRPGVAATGSHDTVESWASGLGMETRAQRLSMPIGSTHAVAPWRTVERLSADARSGDAVAQRVWREANEVLGWAIAQVITLLAPDIVVVGGGVAQAGDDLFWDPLRREVARYVFPPLADSYQLAPAHLGANVVLHGAGVAAHRALEASRHH
ncbi:MAG: ROK family protein [Pirellulales bacterium]